MLVASESYQTFTGESDPTGTIWLELIPLPDNGDMSTILPCSCVTADSFGTKQVSFDGTYTTNGTIDIAFMSTVDSSDTEGLLQLMSHVEDILDDLQSASGTGGNLIINSISRKSGPTLNHLDDTSMGSTYAQMIVTIDWGMS